MISYRSQLMQMQKDKSAFLGEQKIFPLLMKMSIPAIVGMMVAGLYNVVDTIFVGRGAGPMAIAGLSIAFPLQMILQGIGVMIGIGSASIISRRLGENNQERAEMALSTATISVVTLSILMTAVVGVFTDPILRLFGASDAVIPYAREYVKTVMWGFPFMAIGMAGNNIIRAEGNSKVSMVTMLIGMIMNIILDPIFIFGLNMGIQGAALATVIGQFFSFLWILYYYASGKSVVKFHRKNLTINFKQLREMAVLGFPNLVQNAGMSILVLIVNNTLLQVSGDLAISTYGMVMRLLSFVIMPLIGFAQGHQPIVGYNYGAKKFDRVKKTLLVTMVSAFAVSLFFYILIMIFPNALIGLFTTDRTLIDASVKALRTMSILMPIISFQLIPSIYFQAIGKGALALFLGLSRQFIVLIPIVLILPRILGLTGVWISFPVSDSISTLITMVFLFFEMRHLNSIHAETGRSIPKEGDLTPETHRG